MRQEAETGEVERASLAARACRWGARDGGMDRRSKERGLSARRSDGGELARRRRRRSSGAEAGGDVSEARDEASWEPLARNGRRARSRWESGGG